MNSILEWLQQWYVEQCDGEWEHCKGIVIDTLDNPGWRVSIDFPTISARSDEIVVDDRNASGWILCRVEGNSFRGFCAPQSLEPVLTEFKSYV